MNTYINLQNNNTPLLNGLSGNQPIEFIQGDDFTYIISFEDNNLANYVDKLIFSCNYFNIEAEFAKQVLEDGTIQFYIDLDTTNAVPITTSYDIIGKFNIDGKTKTYSETDIMFRVKERENPIKGEVS